MSFEEPTTTTPILEEKELNELVDKAWDEAWKIIHLEDGWKEEKKNDDNGDVVYSRKKENGKRVYRITISVDCPPEKLIKGFEDCKDLTTWNTTLTRHEVLKNLDNGTKVSYQVTAEAGPGGVVSARDFILISKIGRKGKEWLQGGCSVNYTEPENKNAKNVRAWNGPGGTFVRHTSDPNKCEFIWLMDCDFKGWMPASVADASMPEAQFQFATCVRAFAKTL